MNNSTGWLRIGELQFCDQGCGAGIAAELPSPNICVTGNGNAASSRKLTLPVEASAKKGRTPDCSFMRLKLCPIAIAAAGRRGNRTPPVPCAAGDASFVLLWSDSKET